MVGLQLGVGAQHLLQQGAQLRCVAHAAFMEGIDDMPRAVDADADQEMAWESQTFGLPRLSARDVQVKDRQRHRQALASLDDPHEIGILQIVVGFVCRHDRHRRVRLPQPASRAPGRAGVPGRRRRRPSTRHAGGTARDRGSPPHAACSTQSPPRADPADPHRRHRDRATATGLAGYGARCPTHLTPAAARHRASVAARSPPPAQHRIAPHHGIARMLCEEQAGGTRHPAELLVAPTRRRPPSPAAVPSPRRRPARCRAAPRCRSRPAASCSVVPGSCSPRSGAATPRAPFRGMAQPMGPLARLYSHPTTLMRHPASVPAPGHRRHGV